MTQNEEPEDIEFAETTAFGHHFVDLSGNIEDLITPEKEGAIYSHFWDDSAKTFRYYRIAFLPKEILQYVEAHVAKQDFEAAVSAGADFEEALHKISNLEIAHRVRAYGNYGRTKFKGGGEIDNRGCAASFYRKRLGNHILPS